MVHHTGRYTPMDATPVHHPTRVPCLAAPATLTRCSLPVRAPVTPSTLPIMTLSPGSVTSGLRVMAHQCKIGHRV